MKKKGGAMLCLAILISAIVLLAVFVGLIFAFEEAFRYEGELIKNVSLFLVFVITISGVIMIVLLNKDKKSQLQFLLNNENNQNICPNCRLNLDRECHCCPNCKTKIGG